MGLIDNSGDILIEYETISTFCRNCNFHFSYNKRKLSSSYYRKFCDECIKQKKARNILSNKDFYQQIYIQKIQETLLAT